MRYRIKDKHTGKIENDQDCIVTQGGEVAWWDDSQGWSVEIEQSRYVVEYCIKGVWVDSNSVEGYCYRLLQT